MANILIPIRNPDMTGSPKMAAFFAQKLHQAGHFVVVAYGDKPSSEEFLDSNRSNSIVDSLTQAGIKAIYFPEMSNTILDIKTIRGLIKLAKSHNINLTIGFNQRDRSYALLLRAILKIKNITSVQNVQLFYGNPIAKFLKQRTYKYLLQNFADTILCTSEIIKNQTINELKIRSKAIFVLPNAIESVNFPHFLSLEKNQLRQEFDINENDLMIVNVGRFSPQKGLHILIDAFRKVENPNVKLVLIGGVTDGISKQEGSRYKQQIVDAISNYRLEDRVILSGFRPDIAKVLSSADIYCHSALWEGPPLPLAVMEALAARLPVIFTDCAGEPEFFKNGEDGFMVTHNNPEELADAMNLLINMDEAKRAEVGNQGKALVDTNYDLEIIGKKFLKHVDYLTHK